MFSKLLYKINNLHQSYTSHEEISWTFPLTIDHLKAAVIILVHFWIKGLYTKLLGREKDKVNIQPVLHQQPLHPLVSHFLYGNASSAFECLCVHFCCATFHSWSSLNCCDKFNLLPILSELVRGLLNIWGLLNAITRLISFSRCILQPKHGWHCI